MQIWFLTVTSVAWDPWPRGKCPAGCPQPGGHTEPPRTTYGRAEPRAGSTHGNVQPPPNPRGRRHPAELEKALVNTSPAMARFQPAPWGWHLVIPGQCPLAKNLVLKGSPCLP